MIQIRVATDCGIMAIFQSSVEWVSENSIQGIVIWDRSVGRGTEKNIIFVRLAYLRVMFSFVWITLDMNALRSKHILLVF